MLAHTQSCPKYIPEVQENEMIKSNRYENEIPVQNNSQINVRDGLTFLLVGGGIGAVLALLFAPKSGREMRSDIADASRRSYDLTVEKANAVKAQSAEALQAVKEKAEAAYEFASTKLNASGDKLADAVSTTAKAVSDGLDEISSETSVRAKHASIGRRAASIF